MSKANANTAAAAAGANSNVASIDDEELDRAVTELETTAGAVEVKGSGNDASLSGRKVCIKIHQGREGDTESNFVFIGVNGYSYQIPRGKPVLIPEEALEVLENAVMKTYPTDGGRVIGERDVPRFGYNEVRGSERDAALKEANLDAAVLA